MGHGSGHERTIRARARTIAMPTRLARRTLSAGAAATVLLGALAAFARQPARAAGASVAPDCRCGHVTAQTFMPQGAALFGADRYLVFTPDSYTGRKAVPLVVVTHGCNTTAAQMEDNSFYDPIAERDGFIVMYPDNNDLVRVLECWNWFNPADQQRGQDDLARIAGMTQTVISTYRIDRQRVYEIGMSAGALLTSDLAAAYPDLYAAVGIMAGGPYGIVGDTCVADGQSPRPGVYNTQLAASAEAAYQEEGPRRRVIPLIVLNGDADNVVNPVCDQLAIEQGLETDNLVIDGNTTSPLSLTPRSTTAGKVPNGRSYEVLDYVQPGGCLIAQHWIVHGLGHDWSGDTSDPHGPSASKASWDFFSRYTLQSTQRQCAPVRQR
jgi:poly(hydroxyalkanoate) depolymerase family esterase